MNNTDALCFRAMNVMRIAYSAVVKPLATTFLRPPKRASRRREAGFAALVCLLWFGATVIEAVETHYVSLDGTNDSVNGYITWAGAATQIQWAVDAAVAGDTILVSNGTYNLTNQINILANITVRSFTEQGHGTNDTIVNGDNYDGKLVTNRCFYMSAGVLDGFTISNGHDIGTMAYSGGGGVFMTNAGALYNCLICNNYCSNNATVSGIHLSGGGGVYIRGRSTAYASSIISNCTIVGNTVETNGLWGAGGGIHAYYGGVVIDSYISGNNAYQGGGIRVYYGAVITNCTVADNLAVGAGGISLSDNAFTRGVVNCVISNNVAYPGDAGGIAMAGALVKNSIIIGNVGRDGGGGTMHNGSILSNCQVVANTASNWPGGGMGGGGVYLNGASGANVIDNCIIVSNVSKSTICGGGGLSVNAWGGYHQYVRNCLVYGNTNSGLKGGGIFSYNGPTCTNSVINCTIVDNGGYGVYSGAYPANSYFDNCIIYSNFTGEVSPVSTTYLTTYWHTACSVTLANGQGNITTNPLFVDWAGRNYRLSNNSPCVNAGTNQSWMANSYDLDRLTRIRYDTVDMGAYELIHSGTIYGFH